MEAVTETQRLYLAFEHAGEGLLKLRVSVQPITQTEQTAFVLIGRGMLADLDGAEFDLVTEP